MQNDDQSPQYAAPAASRLLDILEILVEEEGGMSLAEISRQLAISTNSAFRICRVMEERGYVTRDDHTGLLRLTSRLYALGMRLGGRMTLLEQAMPVLRQLTEDTGENAHLNVLRDGQAILLGQTVCHHPVRVMVETGSLLYPHANAFAKVILADLPADARAAMLATPWPALTPYTKTDPEELAREWDAVAAAGIAYDHEEYMIGVRCVGAPIRNAEGEVVAGLGVMGPSYRVTEEKLLEFTPLVRAAAAAVSVALGASEPEIIPV